MKYSTLSVLYRYLFLTIVVTLSTSSQALFAQSSLLDQKISVQLEEETLSDALSKIEEKAACFFSYTPSLLNLDHRITKNFADEALHQILDELLSEFKVYYRVRGNTIHIQADSRKGTVKGEIKTSNGEGAAYVSIILKGTNYGTATDENGEFSFYAPQGEYNIAMSAVGLKMQEHPIVIDPGKVTQLAFILDEDTRALQEVLVQGAQGNKFSQKETQYVSRLPINNIENPQVYSVITKDLLDEQVVIDMEDAYYNAPGVSNVADNTGGGITNTQVMLRGFRTTTTLRNGVASAASFSDPILIESIEVVKGPSGTLYGNSDVGNGGMINRVTKQAHAGFKGEASYTTGSWNMNRATLDLNTPVQLPSNSKLFLRLNTAFQSNGSFREQVNKKTFIIAPSNTYQATDKLTLHLDMDYYTNSYVQASLRLDDSMISEGGPYFGKTFDDVPLNGEMSYANALVRSKVNTFNVFANAEYEISSNWTSQTFFSMGTTESDPISTSVVLISEDSLERSFNNTQAIRNVQQFQQNFTGDFYIGSLRNRLVAGFDYRYYSTWQNKMGRGGMVYDKIGVNQTDYENVSLVDVEGFLQGLNRSINESDQTNTEVFFSDMLNITERWNVMASLRLEHFKNDSYDQVALSPKFGTTYQLLADRLSVFANYMNGYSYNSPTVSDLSGEEFNYKPTQINQWETGLKANLSAKVTANISYYDILMDDILRPNPEDPVNLPRLQDGSQTSKGFDFELIMNPVSGLNVLAGYNYNKSEFVKTDDESLEGKTPQRAPEHVANAWASYQFSRNSFLGGFGIGAGINYTSEYFYNDDNTFSMPAYAVAKGTLFYNQPHYRISLKVNNITNEDYWVIGGSQPMPQAPREYLVNIALKF